MRYEEFTRFDEGMTAHILEDFGDGYAHLKEGSGIGEYILHQRVHGVEDMVARGVTELVVDRLFEMPKQILDQVLVVLLRLNLKRLVREHEGFLCTGIADVVDRYLGDVGLGFSDHDLFFKGKIDC